MSDAKHIADFILEANKINIKDFIAQNKIRGPYRKSDDKFKNSDGTLSTYAFACGYVEKTKVLDHTISLWKEGCWHVRVIDDTGRRVSWESFSTKGEAVLFRKEWIKKLKNQ